MFWARSVDLGLSKRESVIFVLEKVLRLAVTSLTYGNAIRNSVYRYVVGG